MARPGPNNYRLEIFLLEVRTQICNSTRRNQIFKSLHKTERIKEESHREKTKNKTNKKGKKNMTQDQNTTPEKKSLFSETRVSKDYNSLLTPGALTSSSQISREKPTDEEWFQVWGNSIDDLEEMAVVKIQVGIKKEDYILRGTKQFKEDAKNTFKKVRMVRVAYYATSTNRNGLWLITVPKESKNGSINAYVATSNEIVEEAQHKWVKKISNTDHGYYEGFYAKPEDQQIFGEPKFKLGYEEAILKSFDKFFITEETIETDPHIRQTMGTLIDLKSAKEENRKTK